MRLIKLGLISVVVLFLLATAIGLLFPSTVVVSRAIDIKSYKEYLNSINIGSRTNNLPLNPSIEYSYLSMGEVFQWRIMLI